KSRALPGDFQPIIAYLFTEWKCNLDCHYCWSYDNRVKGMTEDTARRAIDWLHSTPCRVLAPTGGEPLLRPDFVHKVVYYAAKKDLATVVHDNGISDTIHINEAQMMHQRHFKHLHETEIDKQLHNYPVVDDLLEWLIDKERQGWKIVDSLPRLQNLKSIMRGVG